MWIKIIELETEWFRTKLQISISFCQSRLFSDFFLLRLLSTNEKKTPENWNSFTCVCCRFAQILNIDYTDWMTLLWLFFSVYFVFRSCYCFFLFTFPGKRWNCRTEVILLTLFASLFVLWLRENPHRLHWLFTLRCNGIVAVYYQINLLPHCAVFFCVCMCGKRRGRRKESNVKKKSRAPCQQRCDDLDEEVLLYSKLNGV